MILLGRDKEKESLELLYQEDKPHFLAVYGRRRVGKTYLIRTYFKDRFFLHHTGMAEVSMETYL